MKLIEKKTEDYLRENNITQYEYRSYIEGANFGANYVLEQIKNILSHPLKYVHSNKSVEERMIADIANIIEQLKK